MHGKRRESQSWNILSEETRVVRCIELGMRSCHSYLLLINRDSKFQPIFVNITITISIFFNYSELLS